MTGSDDDGQPKNRQIFISHISEEAKLAKCLKAYLEKAFSRCTVFASSSERDSVAGKDWLETIKAALDESDILLSICSPRSIKKPWINFEAGCAWIKRITVLPVCHSGQLAKELPQPLCRLTALELESVAFTEKLIGALHTHLKDAKKCEISHCEFRQDLDAAKAADADVTQEPNTRVSDKRIDDEVIDEPTIPDDISKRRRNSLPFSCGIYVSIAILLIVAIYFSLPQPDDYSRNILTGPEGESIVLEGEPGEASPKTLEGGHNGEDFSSIDLSGRILKGSFVKADFEGTDLSRAICRDADFTEAILDNVTCNDTVLSGAVLTKANCTSANITNSFLNGATCTGAVFNFTDFRGTNLWRVDLTKAQLNNATCSDADFTKAILKDAECRSTFFRRAILEDANCANAIFSDATFIEAKCSKAIFTKADFKRADCTKAVFKQANCTDADFEDAILEEADCEGADFTNAVFDKAKLSKAILKSAIFQSASLRLADCSRTDFTGADLSKADLTAADFSFANLGHASLADVDAFGTIFNGADFLNTTLNKVDFHGAILLSADFRDANLRNADLSSADFTFVKLERADLRGANLRDIENFEAISTIKGANIYGVKDAPEEFIDWALKHGAVELESDEEWEKWKNEEHS